MSAGEYNKNILVSSSDNKGLSLIHFRACSMEVGDPR